MSYSHVWSNITVTSIIVFRLLLGFCVTVRLLTCVIKYKGFTLLQFITYLFMMCVTVHIYF